MSWSTPVTTFAVHDVLSAAEMNAIGANLNVLKVGLIAPTLVTSTSAATTGTTPLTLATSGVFAANGTTQAKITFSYRDLQTSVGTDTYTISILDNGTQIGQGFTPNPAAAMTNTGGGSVRAVHTPSAGNHTYTVVITRIAGSGTATMLALPTAPAILTVE